MDINKYLGTVPEGEHVGRITQVEAASTQDGGDKLVFHVDYPELNLRNKFINRSLKETALSMLRDDLAAAEVLREGDAYPDNPHELAAVLERDLGDRFLIIRVKNGTSGFQNFKIVGIALQAA